MIKLLSAWIGQETCAKLPSPKPLCNPIYRKISTRIKKVNSEKEEKVKTEFENKELAQKILTRSEKRHKVVR